MSTRIMIERKFKNPISSDILRIIDEIRVKALRQRGYIGGETVVNVDDDRDVLVISSWASVDDWEAWYETKDWKAKDAEYVARKRQLDFEKEMGNYVPAADVAKVWCEHINAVRKRLLSIPRAMATRLQGETKRATIEKEIRTELHSALEELSE